MQRGPSFVLSSGVTLAPADRPIGGGALFEVRHPAACHAPEASAAGRPGARCRLGTHAAGAGGQDARDRPRSPSDFVIIRIRRRSHIINAKRGARDGIEYNPDMVELSSVMPQPQALPTRRRS